MADAPICLMVCAGKDCRRAKGFADLVAAAATVDGAVQVACQDLCDGPIVGLRDRRGVRWYSGVNSSATRRLVLRTVGDGRVRKRLAALEVRKHRDEVRHPRKVRRLRMKLV